MDRPTDLTGSGLDLWELITRDYDLEPYEETLLADACRIRTAIDVLDAQVKRDGLMVYNSQGQRLHPAIAEARQQRIALARFLKTLDLPASTGGEDLPSNVHDVGELKAFQGRAADRGTA